MSFLFDVDQIKELAFGIRAKDTLQLKTGLISLYNRELFEKMIYFSQNQILEGEMIGSINHMIEQEEEHSFLIKTILRNSDIKFEENPKLPRISTQISTADALKYDIEQESISTQEYKKAIAKASGNLKKVLEHILQEEFEHIGILEKYLEEL